MTDANEKNILGAASAAGAEAASIHEAIMPEISPALEQAIRLLRQAQYEIAQLQSEVAFFRSKANAYDLLARIVGAMPDSRNYDASVDVKWMIDDFVEKHLKPQATQDAEGLVNG